MFCGVAGEKAKLFKIPFSSTKLSQIQLCIILFNSLVKQGELIVAVICVITGCGSRDLKIGPCNYNINSKNESAKLRALRAKNVLACQHASRANVPCVLTCSLANVPCVLTCSRANVPCMLTCSCVNVPSSVTLIHI